MNLFSTRSVTISASTGAFRCPECTGSEYRIQRVRRFFTLSVMPVVPLGLLGEYVECQLCKGTFDPAILDHSHESEHRRFEAAFAEGIKRVMVLMMLADKRVEEAEIKAIIDVFGKVTGRTLTKQDVKREILIARSKGEDLDQYLEGLLGRINNDGKELVVKSAYLIAQADGHIDPTELALLQQIGLTLEMSSAHVDDVVALARASL